MDTKIEATMKALTDKGYQVRYFSTGQEAGDYLEEVIRDTTVGLGDSATLSQLRIGERLAKHNQVLDPDAPPAGKSFRAVAREAMATDCYLLSANGLSQDGILVNLDGTGNRVAGSLFGHQRVYYVVGVQKIAPDLEQTLWRVRNIAAPKNAVRLGLRTPCGVKGDRCYDCSSPERICNGLVIHLSKIDSAQVEVILVGEELGF